MNSTEFKGSPLASLRLSGPLSATLYVGLPGALWASMGLSGPLWASLVQWFHGSMAGSMVQWQVQWFNGYCGPLWASLGYVLVSFFLQGEAQRGP